MNTFNKYLLLFAASVGLTMCQKREVTPENPTAAAMTASAEMCGAPTTCTLYAGQTIESGTVSVSNNATTLFVTYTTTGTFNTLHLWAGTSLDLVPSTPGGTPIPGQFPYTYDATGLSTYTFEIPLSDIAVFDATTCGPTSAPIYVIAHAENNTLNNGAQTAFGGCTGVNIETPGRWYYYMSHVVQCCSTPPPPPTTDRLGTAFAKGGYVFTTDPKSNPERLPSLNLTKNRWGWAINAPAGTTTYDLWAGAGLNKTASGIRVGSVTVTYASGLATVTYNLLPGYSMEESHVYAADARPTTVAPGQYGNTYYYDPYVNTATYTYPVSDADGDGKIWVIAHAIAYGPRLTVL